MTRFSIHAERRLDAPINPEMESATIADLPDSADELAAVMRDERAQLKHSLQALGSAVKEKVEWRSHVRDNALAVAGVGFLAGAALGVISARRGGVSAAAPGRTGRERPGNGVGLSMLANMSATIAAMVGRRVAGVAEDALRQALTKRRAR